MDALDVLDIFLLTFVFVGAFMFIIELCTDIRANEISGTHPVFASSSVNVNVHGGSQTAAARAGGGAALGGGGGGGAKDVTIVIRDGISGKVNTTSTNKCGICEKAIQLESVSVKGDIGAGGSGDGNDDGVDSGAAGGVTGGSSHAK